MSLSYVVDGETELDSALFNPWVDHMNGLQTGALPIALAGIEGALAEYGPTSYVRTPLEFGGVGDGVTDDYAAIMAAYADLPAEGGILDLAGRKWYSSQTLDFDGAGAFVLDGGVRGEIGSAPVGGGLKFPLGIDGVIIRGADTGSTKAPTVRNLTIRTSQGSSRPSAGTGHGLVMEAARSTVSGVKVWGFQGGGFYYGSAPVVTGVNVNLGRIEQCVSIYNAGHGLHLQGDDSNVITVAGGEFNVNGGYGIYSDGSYNNAFLSPHASNNVIGDFYENSWSPFWLSPYSEGEGKFVIGDGSRHGVINMGLGGPRIWYDDDGTLVEGFYLAYNYGWTVINRGRHVQHLAVESTADMANQRVLEIVADTPGNGSFKLRLRDVDYGNLGDLVQIRNLSSTTNGEWRFMANRLGFFGATAVAQPAANPDTSGASLTDLETEVNELKATLRTLGLIAT